MDKQNNALVVFQDKNIRRIWHNDEWYFSVIDIVQVLTESVDAKDYWYRLKQREKEGSEIELSKFCRQLKLKSGDGKGYEDPKQYINKMKQRDDALGKAWVQIVHTLQVKTSGGKQPMNCADTEGIFRIIQSMPSKKAG